MTLLLTRKILVWNNGLVFWWGPRALCLGVRVAWVGWAPSRPPEPIVHSWGREASSPKVLVEGGRHRLPLEVVGEP